MKYIVNVQNVQVFHQLAQRKGVARKLSLKIQLHSLVCLLHHIGMGNVFRNMNVISGIDSLY